MQESEALKKARQYAKEYRREGFGKEADRRYYMRHCKELRKKARDRYHSRRDDGI